MSVDEIFDLIMEKVSIESNKFRKDRDYQDNTNSVYAGKILLDIAEEIYESKLRRR